MLLAAREAYVAASAVHSCITAALRLPSASHQFRKSAVLPAIYTPSASGWVLWLYQPLSRLPQGLADDAVVDRRLACPGHGACRFLANQFRLR